MLSDKKRARRRNDEEMGKRGKRRSKEKGRCLKKYEQSEGS